jgi:chemotaxis protein histidine kinase CheA
MCSCTLCGKSFKEKFTLNRHVREVHSKRKIINEIQNEECNKRLKVENSGTESNAEVEVESDEEESYDKKIEEEESDDAEEIESGGEEESDDDEEIESGGEEEFDDDEEIKSGEEEESDEDEEIESGEEEEYDDDEEIESGEEEEESDDDEEIESGEEEESDDDDEEIESGEEEVSDNAEESDDEGEIKAGKEESDDEEIEEKEDSANDKNKRKIVTRENARKLHTIISENKNLAIRKGKLVEVNSDDPSRLDFCNLDLLNRLYECIIRQQIKLPLNIYQQFLEALHSNIEDSSLEEKFLDRFDVMLYQPRICQALRGNKKLSVEMLKSTILELVTFQGRRLTTTQLTFLNQLFTCVEKQEIQITLRLYYKILKSFVY